APPPVGWPLSAAHFPASPPATPPTAAPTAVPTGPAAEPAAAPTAAPLAAPAPTPTGCAPGALLIGSGLASGTFCDLSFVFFAIAPPSRLGARALDRPLARRQLVARLLRARGA